MTNSSRILAPPALGFYIVLIIHGALLGVDEGFYSVYITQELNVPEIWYGKFL